MLDRKEIILATRTSLMQEIIKLRKTKRSSLKAGNYLTRKDGYLKGLCGPHSVYPRLN
jgi:hypothetical protein